jgi:hypothetical protein
VPIVKKEDSGLSKKQALGKCYGIYDSHKRSTGEAEPGEDGIRPSGDLIAPIRAVVGDDGKTRYKVYGSIFGGPDNLDAYRTYFDEGTNYYLDWYRTRPWLYHHGLHPMARCLRIGELEDWDVDEEGLFFWGEMLESFKYKKAVEQLIDKECLYSSQGTAAYLSNIEWHDEGEDEGRGWYGYVTDWPITEVSATVRPANFGQKAVTPEVVRAIRALEGGIMVDGTSLMDLLNTFVEGVRGRSSEPGTEEQEEGTEAQVQEEQVGEEGQTPLSVEEVARALHFPELIESIQRLDQVIEELDARQAAVEEVVAGLAETEVERVRNALGGDDNGQWWEQLYAASREGPPATEKEVQQAKLPEGNPVGGEQADDPAVRIMAQQGQHM